MIHKHHIVPRYKCKELGIDPDFDDNFVEVTRHQHALIHWGYYCEDLSPLLEVCSPPQYVLDMIPLGDIRDVPSAQLLAEGEIDGIDLSGIPRSEETKKKISIANTGKVRSEETKQKISNKLKGTRMGKDNPMFGKTGKDSPTYKHGKSGTNEYAREIRLKNPEKCRERVKKWADKNREYLSIKRKERYQKIKSDPVKWAAHQKRQSEWHKQNNLKKKQGKGTLDSFL